MLATLTRAMRLPHLSSIVITILLAAACIAGFLKLGALLSYEMHPVHHGGDGAIYTAIGRGIVNGLVPYRDLFEAKPPGMFLISALSLWMFDTIQLANILQGIALGGIVIAILLPLFGARYRTKKWQWGLWLAGAFLFGTLAVHYLAERAGHFQTESFGSFFIALFLALFAIKQERWHFGATLLSGILLACAIGLKEPFLLVIFGCLLLLIKKPADMVQRFLIPLGIAGGIGILVMGLFDYLMPYLQIYLPEMIAGRSQTFLEPIWVLPLLVFRYPLLDIATFSPIFLLLLIVLWLSSLLFAADAWHSRKRLLTLGILLGTLVLLATGFWYVMVSALLSGVTYKQLVFPYFLLFGGYWIIAWFGTKRFAGPDGIRAVFVPFLLHVAAVAIITTAAGTGGFLMQQFGFLVPLFMTLLFSVTLSVFRHHTQRASHILLWIIPCIAAIGVLLLPGIDYAKRMQERKDAALPRMLNAQAIDAMMDRCGFDRYQILGEPVVPYEFTKHSPYGPGFHRVSFVFPLDWRPPPQPYLQETYRANLQKTPLLIMPAEVLPDGRRVPAGKYIPADVQQYVEQNFTGQLPACAKGFAPSFDQFFVFRNA